MAQCLSNLEVCVGAWALGVVPTEALSFSSHILSSWSSLIWIGILNTLASGCFRGFSKKKHLNARGFVQEYLRSCTGYELGQSVQRRGKSSSLHSEKFFLLRECGFFVSDVISGGLLGHLGPLCLALGTNCLVVVFRWSFYWKLGYNPSLLILRMTCWFSGSKIMI